jgi:hypothetical protein
MSSSSTRTTTTTKKTTTNGDDMAEITIRFRHNQTTGKRELVIHLESDDDVLGHEHERDHRRLVERLLGVPLDDNTGIVVERGEASPATPTPAGASAPAPSSTRQTQGNRG